MDTSLYPADHPFAMEVPEGGAACSKCHYLELGRDGERPKCMNHYFRKWNKGEYLPKPPTRYCCDDFEARSER